MIKVRYKNLERSESSKNTAEERVQAMVAKFPELQQSQSTVTLEMENSPVQAGPDRFSVTFRSVGGKFNNTVLKKSSHSIYVALAELVDGLLEKLNRATDKIRVKRRNRARKEIEAIYYKWVS